MGLYLLGDVRLPVVWESDGRRRCAGLATRRSPAQGGVVDRAARVRG